ncbi:MAG: hypothetical protein U9Q81_14805 [Pseudomonadota bacterium]|nr:hypothetical protein [Pseudomonadota bacterium]
MKATLIRIVLILAIVEIAYLSLVNLALNLPVTQSLINQHRPDKYAVYWEKAWSWYPLRIHATGISVNGQTSSQQWQADASAASASLSVLPLFRRTVKVYGVDAQDLAFRLRPRPKPEKDYAAIREFFPPIRDREPNLPAAARKTRKKGDGWRIVVGEIHARGSHELWVFQVRGALVGDVQANVTHETRGGPLALTDGEADVELKSLMVNKDSEVSSGGAVKGRFEIAPFVPAENPGLKALAFLSVDAEINTAVNSLDFLDFYLRGIGGMEIDGKGRLSGPLRYERGDLTSGTDLALLAEQLELAAVPYEVKGAGGVDIAVRPEDPETLSVEISFGALEALHEDDQVPLFTGSHLEVAAQGTTRILPDEARKREGGRVLVRIPSVTVPDLKSYQRYLPDKWGIRVLGGHGELAGKVEFSATALSADLNLVSADADVVFKDYQFKTNLDLGVKVSGGASETAGVDLSGTYLRLDEARLTSESTGESEAWQASLSITQGTLGLPVPEGSAGDAGFKHLSQALNEQGLKTLLASADAKLDADLSVSDLGWVDLLFTNPYDMAVSGSGEAAADVRIHSGWLSEGTILRVRPRGLRVQVLDYVAQGGGSVALKVEKGGESPDMSLDVQLSDALLRRRGEEEAVVERVKLGVSTRASGVTFGGGSSVASLDLRIPSARVKDMSVYNQYLPEGSPLELLSGEADLTADIHLEPESAGGFVKLKTNGLRSRLDDQEVSGELTLDINLQDGVPSNMDFDISGSSLLLDGFKVAGEQKGFGHPDWTATFDLRKARAVWKKPVRLDVEAEIAMKDSRPIVAVFANQRGKHGWLEKILTVEDVRGEAKMNVASNRVLIPYAVAGSDKIDVGAKGVIDANHREGIFYARFRKLHGILKVKDGDRNFDIIGARKKFDAYSPGEPSTGEADADGLQTTGAILEAGERHASEKDKNDVPARASDASTGEREFSVLDETP